MCPSLRMCVCVCVCLFIYFGVLFFFGDLFISLFLPMGGGQKCLVSAIMKERMGRKSEKGM